MREKSPIAAGLWMVVLSLLLAWIPLIGPAVAGFVGGLFSPNPTVAVLIGLIPASLAALVIFLVGGVLDIALLAGFLAAGAFIVIAVQSIPLLIGAWLGAEMSARRTTV